MGTASWGDVGFRDRDPYVTFGRLVRAPCRIGQPDASPYSLLRFHNLMGSGFDGSAPIVVASCHKVPKYGY